MKKAIFGFAALAALIVAGCSKDDEDGGGSREQMIRGKWYPVSTKVFMIDRTQNTTKTTYPAVYAGDYVDFRNDGKVYSYKTDPNEGPGYDPHDTLVYKFGNPYLIIGEDTLSPVITKDSLKLILQENTPSQSWETTFTFKR